MRRVVRLAVAALLATLPGCESDPAPEIVPASTASSKAVFSWNAPGSVQVREKTRKDGNAVEAEYWLDVCPRGPDTLTVAYADYRVLALNGLPPAASSEVAAAIAQVSTLGAAMPKMIIGTDGTLRDIEGIDALFERMRRIFPDRDLSKVQEMLKQPNAREVFVLASGKAWKSWVEAWLTIDPQAGSPQLLEEQVPGMNGLTLKAEVTFVQTRPGLAKLTRRSTASQDVATALLRGTLASFATTIEAPFDVALEMQMETETEWPNLRPRSVRTRSKAHITVASEKATRFEEHTYTFDWRAGIGRQPCRDR